MIGRGLAVCAALAVTPAQGKVPDPFAPDWPTASQNVDIGRVAMCARIGEALHALAADGMQRRAGSTWKEHTKDMEAFVRLTDRLMTLAKKHCEMPRKGH